MTRRKWLWIVVAVVVVAAAGTAIWLASKPKIVAKADQPRTYRVVARVEVLITEDGIEQPTVKVKPDTAVTWFNNDDKPHHLISTAPKPPNGFESDNIPAGQRYTFVFHNKGTYQYQAQDDPTKENSGTIRVE